MRVGLAIAKTIAYVLKSKIAGVSSLDVLVANISNNLKNRSTRELGNWRTGQYEYVCPVIDARWNQVYTAIYEKKRTDNVLKYKRISNYLAISPQDLVKLLKRYTRKADDRLLLFGDGIRAYKELFDGLGKKIILGSPDIWFPEARNVALLGYQSYKQGRYDDPIKLVPLYLRLTEAEVNLKIRNTNKLKPQITRI